MPGGATGSNDSLSPSVMLCDEFGLITSKFRTAILQRAAAMPTIRRHKYSAGLRLSQFSNNCNLKWLHVGG